MNILVTGADGFVGRVLVQRLLTDTHAWAAPLRQLVLVDKQFNTPSAANDPRTTCITGSFGDAAVLREALTNSIDLAFHLASIPGGAAEQNYELGQQVNLFDTLTLFDHLR